MARLGALGALRALDGRGRGDMAQRYSAESAEAEGGWRGFGGIWDLGFGIWF